MHITFVCTGNTCRSPMAQGIFDVILKEALDFSIASASVGEIEEINILNAAMLAMNRAISSLKIKPDLALIDGNTSRGFTLPTRTVVGGDAICPSIAAASILAKVTRDRMCLDFDNWQIHFIRHHNILAFYCYRIIFIC